MVRVHEFVHRLAKTWLLVLHGRGSPSGSGPWTPRPPKALLRCSGDAGDPRRCPVISRHRAGRPERRGRRTGNGRQFSRATPASETERTVRYGAPREGWMHLTRMETPDAPTSGCR